MFQCINGTISFAVSYLNTRYLECPVSDNIWYDLACTYYFFFPYCGTFSTNFSVSLLNRLAISISRAALFFLPLMCRPDSSRYIAFIFVWNGIIDCRGNITRTYSLTTCRRNGRISRGFRVLYADEFSIPQFAVIFTCLGANQLPPGIFFFLVRFMKLRHRTFVNYGR